MKKQYKIVYIDREGRQSFTRLYAESASEAKANFLSGHPGYKVIAVGEC